MTSGAAACPTGRRRHLFRGAVDYLEAVVEAQGLKQFSLFGMSQGGGINKGARCSKKSPAIRGGAKDWGIEPHSSSTLSVFFSSSQRKEVERERYSGMRKEGAGCD
jgi:hypothetical protein